MQANIQHDASANRSGQAPSLAPDMDERLKKALASKNELASGKLQVKARDWNREVFLPFELSVRIAGLLAGCTERANFRLTSRQGYASVDKAWPLYRLRGLTGDLMGTATGNSKTTLAQMQTFDDQLRSGGLYDQALLTPLSEQMRMTMGLGMMVWTSKHVDNKDKSACSTLVSARFKTELEALKLQLNPQEMEPTLRAAVRGIETTPPIKLGNRKNMKFSPLAVPTLLNVLDKNLQGAVVDEIVVHAFKLRGTADFACKRVDQLSATAQVLVFFSDGVVLDNEFEKFCSSLMRNPAHQRGEKLAEVLAVARQHVAGIQLGPQPRFIATTIITQQRAQFCWRIMAMCATACAALKGLPDQVCLLVMENAVNLFKEAKRMFFVDPQTGAVLPRGDNIEDFVSGYLNASPGNFNFAHLRNPIPSPFHTAVADGYAYRSMQDEIYRLSSVYPEQRAQFDSWLRQMHECIASVYMEFNRW